MKSYNHQNEKQLYLIFPFFTSGSFPDDIFHPLVEIQNSEVILRRFIKSEEELFYTGEFSDQKDDA